MNMSVQGNGLKRAGALTGTWENPVIKRKTGTITMTIKMVSLQRGIESENLYEANHTHICKDRIVSLEQPFVRPINPGKRPNPTEFGQKLHLSVVDGYTYLEQMSWSNFNEGCDHQTVAEDYCRKFGCYPEAILADKIYQSRENRRYCAEHDIRLNGPALGRPKKGDTGAKEARQIYKDACARNAVEGRNGNLKRRYGLGLIMSKLDETAKAEAALNILAMNVAHRLHRWLLRFFCISAVYARFSVSPIYYASVKAYLDALDEA